MRSGIYFTVPDRIDLKVLFCIASELLFIIYANLKRSIQRVMGRGSGVRIGGEQIFMFFVYLYEHNFLLIRLQNFWILWVCNSDELFFLKLLALQKYCIPTIRQKFPPGRQRFY